MKKMRLQSHEQGPPCNCTRLKCYEAINNEERKCVLQKFNNLTTNDEQNSYLCGLITIVPVQLRRSRQSEEEVKFHAAAFSYKVRVKREDVVIEIPVCYKAFKSIHGISKGKLEFLQKSLKENGIYPKDRRGKHSSQHRSIKEDVYKAIYDHINSFRARKSHYSMHDSN